jgi:cytochrome b pre-mRNA-processing protein 3
VSLLARMFGETKERAALAPLYRAVVARGRDPIWYRDWAVPDTIDGRFDMIAAVLALVLIRLEAGGEAGRRASVLLTEIFIDDMDGTLRQIGIGDYVVGKHVGRMVSALGGRLGAFRTRPFEPAVRRNIFHDSPPDDEAPVAIAGRLEGLAAALAEADLAALLAGDLP